MSHSRVGQEPPVGGAGAPRTQGTCRCQPKDERSVPRCPEATGLPLSASTNTLGRPVTSGHRRAESGRRIHCTENSSHRAVPAVVIGCQEGLRSRCPEATGLPLSASTNTLGRPVTSGHRRG